MVLYLFLCFFFPLFGVQKIGFISHPRYLKQQGVTDIVTPFFCPIYTQKEKSLPTPAPSFQVDKEVKRNVRRELERGKAYSKSGLPELEEPPPD